MKRLLLVLPLLAAGCAQFRDPMIPDGAYKVIDAKEARSFKQRYGTVGDAMVRFDKVFLLLTDRYGVPESLGRRRPNAKVFSPDAFARWKQTDEHLAFDLYVEDWTQHQMTDLHSEGIIFAVTSRDFRAEEARTKKVLEERLGVEGAKKHLDKDGKLKY